MAPKKKAAGAKKKAAVGTAWRAKQYRELLRRIEWRGRVDDDGTRRCPACDSRKPDGHDGCEIYEALHA